MAMTKHLLEILEEIQLVFNGITSSEVVSKISNVDALPYDVYRVDIDREQLEYLYSRLNDVVTKEKIRLLKEAEEDPDDLILIHYFEREFVPLMLARLKGDQRRWGNTWRQKNIADAPTRIMARYRDYYDQYKNGKLGMPWLKVVGNAVCAKAREDHPEWLMEEEDNG
jgi:hypothetical protein